jgi:hypothetical protein
MLAKSNYYSAINIYPLAYCTIKCYYSTLTTKPIRVQIQVQRKGEMLHESYYSCCLII